MAGKTYTTFNKIRFVLFTRSYAHYFITQYINNKYKINDRLPAKTLQKKYFNKYAVPEISRLAKILNFKYHLLWKSIILNDKPSLSKKVSEKEKVEIYLSVEDEITQLFIQKQKQHESDYVDPDYEGEFALLSMAVERAVGDVLDDIEDDFLFSQKSEELKRKYIYLYYKIAYKYKLPTLRITPFILRLIS
ncbi:MAG: hypothetical protein AAB553_01300 [Patescibacteria group bacterium]